MVIPYLAFISMVAGSLGIAKLGMKDVTSVSGRASKCAFGSCTTSLVHGQAWSGCSAELNFHLQYYSRVTCLVLAGYYLLDFDLSASKRKRRSAMKNEKIKETGR